MLKRIASLTSVAALLSGAALAGQDNGLSEYDIDGDGQLSLREVQIAKPDVTEDQFNQYDADGSGYLNKEEFTEWKDSLPKESDDENDGTDY